MVLAPYQRQIDADARRNIRNLYGCCDWEDYVIGFICKFSLRGSHIRLVEYDLWLFLYI